jgi:AraC-like DNA-binding protein
VHPRAFGYLVDGVARPVDSESDQVKILSGHGSHGGPVVPVVTGREQIRGEDRQGEPAADSALAGRGERLLAPLEDEHRLPEHRQVLSPVRVRIGLADHFGHTLPETTHEKRRDIQPLPDFQVLTQHNRDFGVEPHRLVSRTSRRIHNRQSNSTARHLVLYDFCVADHPRIRAWRPHVPGVAEVLHAHMTSHVYPMHTHESWALLIVDDGMIRYDLHRHEHGALYQAVTLLPPQVPHNGRAATSRGFRKRVIYLDLSHVPARLIGRAVDKPVLLDPVLRQRINQLHLALDEPGRELEAESRLAFVAERLQHHLGGPAETNAGPPAANVAHELRELIDTRFREKVTLRQASETIHAHPAHLVRMFSREFGISPHQYLTGRRLDLARRLLLDGMPPSTAAVTVGFCDQSHLNRTFKRLLGTSPARFASGNVGPK